MAKIALITGITGQDGAYLAEFLLKKGYIVHGIKRRSSLFNTNRIDHIYEDPHQPHKHFFLHYGDMTDSLNILNLIQKIQPDEIYNLAAQSHVKVSFETPEYTANTDALGTLRILEAIKTLGLVKKTKFYQASTSELFGKSAQIPQNENTPFYPRSPYAVAKLYAYWITVNYREAYGLFASNGILFNHESPIRGETFVTRKITRAITRIVLGLQDCLWLGNLDAIRDWGHAKDYVIAMHLILQHSQPDDFIIATGNGHTVREFVTKAFEKIGIIIEFKGKGVKEVGVISEIKENKYNIDSTKSIKKGQIVVRIDPRYFRPTEVDILIGDASKARKLLGWEPKYTFDELIEEMIEKDLQNAQKEIFLINNGFKTFRYYE